MMLIAAGAVVASGLVALLVLARPWTAIPIAFFIVYADFAGVAIRSQDAPVFVGMAVPMVLAVPIAQRLVRGQAMVTGPAFGPIVALLAVGCVATALSPEPAIAAEELFSFAISGVLLYLLVVNAVREPEDLRRAVWAVIGAAAMLAAVTVYQRLTGAFDRPFGGFAEVDGAYLSGRTDHPRSEGPLDDPNYYAQMLLPPVALGLVLSLRPGRPRMRLAAGAATALMLLAIAFTYSRGAALAMVVLVLALAALRIVSMRQLAVAAAAMTVVVAADPAYRERLSTFTALGGLTARSGDSGAADQAARSRATENLAALLAFRDRPIVGSGPGVFPSLYQRYAPQVGIEVYRSGHGAEPGEKPEREAHNLFLGLAADLGLAGLAAFLAVLWISFRALASARHAWSGTDPATAAVLAGLTVGLLAYVVAGVFLSLAFERFFWLLVGLAGAAATLTRATAPSPGRSVPCARTSRRLRLAERDPAAFRAGPA